MGWAENVQKPVRSNNGETLALYNQGKDNRVKSGVNRGGWCLAMSIMWIIKDAQNQSFWEWFGPPAQACPTLANRNANAAAGEVYNVLSRLMETDAKVVNALRTSHVAPHTALAWFTPKIEHDTQCKRDRSGDELRQGVVVGDVAAQLLARTHGYKLLSGYGGGAHAMASRVVDGSVVFMDPNFGEFWFPSVAAFRGFMKTFWRASKYQEKFNGITAVTSFTDPNFAILRG